MHRIGVVGAGAGAAAFTHTVAGESVEITVLEKSGGVCGRAATRRRGDATYDYGANFLRGTDDRVNALLDAVGTEGRSVIAEPTYAFDAEGTVSPGRDPESPRWTFERGLTQVAKRLFADTDATIQRRTRIETVVRDGAEWALVDSDGERWGPFDTVVCNPPAPQTAELLRDTEWRSDARDEALAAISSVDYEPNYTAVLGYLFELDRPYYAAVNTDGGHVASWIARESCKPGHVPDGETVLVVQSNPEWAAARYDDPAAENVAALADAAADVLGDDRLRDPDWTDHQGWRYAHPREHVDADALDPVREEGVRFVGDWVADDDSLHAALKTGLEEGDSFLGAL